MQSNFGIREERETLISAFFCEGGVSYHGIFAFILLNLTKDIRTRSHESSMGCWTQIQAYCGFSSTLPPEYGKYRQRLI